MTNEQQFFLNALADHLNKRETHPPDGLDWTLIAAYAKSHQVEGIIWHQCKTFLSNRDEYSDIRKRLETSSISSLFYYANNVNALRELKRIFLENHIRFFTVKGLDVAQLYPVPAYRTMGDIDVIISEEDRSLIDGIMTGMGYKSANSNDYELNYHNRNTHFEIHDHLIYKQNQEFLKRKNYFDNCWENVKEEDDGSLSLNWNFHFAFLVQHTKKHFSGNGLGFRQFMDVAIVAREVPNLDWERIEKDLRRIDLWDFTLRAFAFCKKWFCIEPPVPTKDLDDSFYEESTDFILKNGVFGCDNEHHKEHALERRIRISKLPRQLRKFEIILKEVFIPYKYMIELPYCKFLIGRKYLLPYAWFYRIFYVICNKEEQLEAERKLLFESEDAFRYHDRLMTRWGL